MDPYKSATLVSDQFPCGFCQILFGSGAESVSAMISVPIRTTGKTVWEPQGSVYHQKLTFSVILSLIIVYRSAMDNHKKKVCPPIPRTVEDLIDLPGNPVFQKIIINSIICSRDEHISPVVAFKNTCLLFLRKLGFHSQPETIPCGHRGRILNTK